MRLFTTLALLALLLVSYAAQAADTYMVGFRTLGQWSPDTGLRLDVNVWYPSSRPPRDLNYAPWEISASRAGKAVDGRFPLLLLSHDTAGTRFSYHDTAAWLASLGFVVAAPNHPGDNMDNMDNLLTWQQLENRAHELSGSIDLLMHDPEVEPSVDATRIGVVGFGVGGASALLLGGALPDCEGWASYCTRTTPTDMYCNPWARERMEALCKRLPLTRSLADTRIRAIAAVAPGFGMLFSRQSFNWFYPPLLLMAAPNDVLNASSLHARRIYELMDKKPRWLSLPQADTGALMAPCPESLALELPELCRSVSAETRTAIHKRMTEALGDFFLHYLGNAQNLPHIPPPPDLTPQPHKVAPEPAPQPAQKAKKRRAN